MAGVHVKSCVTSLSSSVSFDLVALCCDLDSIFKLHTLKDLRHQVRGIDPSPVLLRPQDQLKDQV